MSLSVSLFSLWLASAPVDDPGQKVFMEYRCNTCHAVASAEIEATEEDEEKQGPDLSTTEKRTAEWVKKYLNKEEAIDGRKHKKRWRGEDAELDALAEWVAGLSK